MGYESKLAPLASLQSHPLHQKSAEQMTNLKGSFLGGIARCLYRKPSGPSLKRVPMFCPWVATTQQRFGRTTRQLVWTRSGDNLRVHLTWICMYIYIYHIYLFIYTRLYHNISWMILFQIRIGQSKHQTKRGKHHLCLLAVFLQTLAWSRLDTGAIC